MSPLLSPRAARGFTLLEVMVAMSILAVSLVALSEINAGSISMHTYAKKLTVATLLAKGKMLDIESQMDSDGLPAEGENIDPSDGDFDDEGFPQYKWKADVVAPKSDNLDASKLIGAMLGGGADPNNPNSSPSNASGTPSLLQALSGSGTNSGGAGGTDGPLGMLSGLLGGGALGGGAGGAAGAGGLANSAMGGMAQSMLAGPAQMMIQQITQMVREVRLTVMWQNGTIPEEFTLVEHTVSMGPTGQLPANATGNNGTTNPNMPTPSGSH